MSARRYLALCVSTKPENWPFQNIPFYCLSDTKHYPRLRSRERIDFLAEKWNQCHEIGIRLFPKSTHIVNVGSQYLRQVSALGKLVNTYNDLDCEIILAGNVWARLESRLLPYKTTYDTWAYPDLAGLTWLARQPRGLVQLNSVGLPCIYPVQSWRDHHFHNPVNMDDGIWYNQFCLESGLPTLVDLSIAFYRSRYDSDIVRLPITKRLRMAFGVRKRLSKIVRGN